MKRFAIILIIGPLALLALIALCLWTAGGRWLLDGELGGD